VESIFDVNISSWKYEQVTLKVLHKIWENTVPPLWLHHIWHFFFEVVFWAFLNFEGSQLGRNMLPGYQNWFWKTWGMYGWDKKIFFDVHTCGTFFSPHREIVRFWANFEFFGNFRVCLLCAFQGIHIWDTYFPGVGEHSKIMVYDEN